ncbi:MAG: hypothetical protein HUU20_11100 [Pirellulales bacterium]|nr:hypothetical protein [Pirellulales bacterium]
MSTGSFSSRTRELEDVFFKQRDEELLRALREQVALKEKKKALADASGISDEEVLDHLHQLDISTETLAAVALIPLIAVAWADGSIDAKEGNAVMAAAEQQGLKKGHPGYQLLGRWLEQRPEPRLLRVWKGYVSGLRDKLGDATTDALKRDVLGRARAVAEAAGGLLGLGNKVSKAEQAVLEDLEKAF